MSKFIWDNRCKIGDTTVDTQHQRLFELANQLVAANGAEEITSLIMLFYQHIREHFQAEESLMKQHGYPAYPTHVEAHNLLLDKLIEISKSIQNKRWNAADIRIFVNHWVLVHILEVDMQFARFQNQCDEI